MTLITAERARELRKGATEGPWKIVRNEPDGDYTGESTGQPRAIGPIKVTRWDGIEYLVGKERDFALASAAPDLADAVIALWSNAQTANAQTEHAEMIARECGAKVARMEAELAEAHALIARQRAILDGVASALKGAPAPGTLHDHSDLAACARAADERATAHGNLLAVIHRDGGYHVGRVGWARASTDAIQDVIALRADNARLRATALTLWRVRYGIGAPLVEFNAAMAHGAELEAGR